MTKSLWAGFQMKSYYRLVDLSPESVNNPVDNIVDEGISGLI
jgi:hypothetical protein